MWNPIKAYTDRRDAKDAKYQRQEQQAKRDREQRRTTERIEIRKMVEADHARRAEINRPGNEAWQARQRAEQQAREAAKAAEIEQKADAFARALVNHGVMNLGDGKVNVQNSVFGPGAEKDVQGGRQRAAEGAERARPGQERAEQAREAGQGSGGVVNYGGDMDISGQAIGWGSSVNDWTQEADSPKAEADWGGWDSSSLDSSLGPSVASYGGDEAQL